ncbi:MAG: ergothioneine biosynthesis protein EgtB [Polyangiaceae bacterium]
MALSLPEVPPTAGLLDRYRHVRAVSEALCAPLSKEDMVVQSMPDVSPTKWHLAHVSWFFETLVLREHVAEYRPLDPAYEVLFNSYYNSIGEQFPRSRRGLLSRPGVDEVLEYRARVDAHMHRLLERGVDDALAKVVEVGLHHEMQHQELLLMDILHVLAQNPLAPAYLDEQLPRGQSPAALEFEGIAGGLVEIGHAGDGFCFDNEGPRHKVWLDDFALGRRLVTNGEYLEFIVDGGYERPLLWLSDGFAWVRQEHVAAPAYWRKQRGEWFEFGLHGLAPVDPALPVCHLSYYEADAFATWAGARLPTEAEWEHASAGANSRGTYMSSLRLHPRPADLEDRLQQLFGDVWEWTQSAYAPYPGFAPASGALGEYNGKFMANQLVLRGGACVTPPGHVRGSYRNFYYPHQRWMFSGLRLARGA